jgi:predicted Zn-dependent protease
MFAREQTAFDGVLHEGRRATARPVRVRADGAELLLSDGTVTGRVPRAGIVADAPVPGVPRTLRLPDGASIETADHAAVEALWPVRGRIARLAYALESRWPAVLACLGAAALGVWLLIAVVLPQAAEPVARGMSPRVDEFLGKQVLATLDGGILAPSELPEAEQEAWQARFDAFLAGEPGADRYSLVFRRAGAPNAFALPDGTIVVTDEMVRIVGSDDELRAVFAHEIGHVRGRHALRLVLQRSGVAVLLTALAGDAVGVTYLAAALPSMLLQSGYSREFEAEADDEAFAQLKRHGVSPQAFADLLRRLEQEEPSFGDQGGVSRYLGSHPATAERIRRAEDAAR